MVSKQEKILAEFKPFLSASYQEHVQDKVKIINMLRSESFPLEDKIMFKTMLESKAPIEIRDELGIEKRKLGYIKKVMRKMYEEGKLNPPESKNGRLYYKWNIEPIMAEARKLKPKSAKEKKVSEDVIRKAIYDVLVKTISMTNKAKVLDFLNE